MIVEKGLLGRYRFRSQCLKRTTYKYFWYYASSAFAREITKCNALNPKLDWIIYVDCSSERTFEDRLILAAIQVVLYIVSILKFPFKASIFLKPFTYSFPPSCKYMGEKRISWIPHLHFSMLFTLTSSRLVAKFERHWVSYGRSATLSCIFLCYLDGHWTNMLRYEWQRSSRWATNCQQRDYITKLFFD